IVFGLHDALPARAAASVRTAKERYLWTERQLVGGHGARLLADPQNASVVEGCLLQDDDHCYSFIASSIIPTHVHVLPQHLEGRRLDVVVQAWKSVSAHRINHLQNRKGSLWRREYFDRFMRTDEQFTATVAYVENNPVSAGLAGRPEDWRFSSAWWRNHAGEG